MEEVKSNNKKFMRTFFLGVILLIIVIVLSITFGAAKLGIIDTWKAIFDYDPADALHPVIRNIRLPRVLATAIVGASFALAGAIMQGITRNPLADAGLLGINAGSTFLLAFCFAFIPGYTYTQAILFSFLGAAIGVSITYYVASISKKKLTPERLVLAGVTVSLLFTALSQFMGIYFGIGQELTYWNVGGVAGVSFDELKLILPWFLVATIGGIIMSPSISILSLGEDVAIGLGQNTFLTKTLATIIVLILAGLGVSIVGPIGFVGLIIPHVARYFVGVDYRLIIPISALFGAIFMTFADFIGRVISAPYETPLGIIFALIGVPYFLYLTRKDKVIF